MNVRYDTNNKNNTNGKNEKKTKQNKNENNTRQININTHTYIHTRLQLHSIYNGVVNLVVRAGKKHLAREKKVKSKIYMYVHTCSYMEREDISDNGYII